MGADQRKNRRLAEYQKMMHEAERAGFWHGVIVGVTVFFFKLCVVAAVWWWIFGGMGR